MRILTRVRLALLVAIVTILLIGLLAWHAQAQVQRADVERQQVSEAARSLNDMRMVAFEYLLHPSERAREQESLAWRRLADLTALAPDDPDSQRTLADLRDSLAEAHRVFVELSTAGPSGRTAPDDAVERRYETLLSNRLLVLQQESLVDASRLGALATGRIDRAQRRLAEVVAMGLALMVLLVVAGAWRVVRGMLQPLRTLEQAMRQVAGGRWSLSCDTGQADEIGELARHFDAMTSTLRASFARIERSNRELSLLNHELEAFSYSVSHDLRGPLRSMDGFSLALLEDYGEVLDDEGKDALQRIRAASQRMGRLIDELLNLSRVARVEMTLHDADLSAIAHEIADDIVRQSPAPRSVRWVIDEGLRVQADPGLLRIALRNLLDNAWKFTGKTPGATIRVGRREVGGRTEYFVADNGVGFDMAYVGRLFGPFQRLHHESDFAGTGVGLAIVQRVFRRHGGDVRAESTPGQGAAFHFWFASAAGEGPARPDDAVPAGPSPGRVASSPPPAGVREACP